MEDTKQNDELTNISGDKEVLKNDEPLPKASISEIYKYLSGPYKMLFFIGSVSAFFGGFNFPLCTYSCQLMLKWEMKIGTISKTYLEKMISVLFRSTHLCNL